MGADRQARSGGLDSSRARRCVPEPNDEDRAEIPSIVKRALGNQSRQHLRDPVASFLGSAKLCGEWAEGVGGTEGADLIFSQSGTA